MLMFICCFILLSAFESMVDVRCAVVCNFNLLSSLFVIGNNELVLIFFFFCYVLPSQFDSISKRSAAATATTATTTTTAASPSARHTLKPQEYKWKKKKKWYCTVAADTRRRALCVSDANGFNSQPHEDPSITHTCEVLHIEWDIL